MNKLCIDLCSGLGGFSQAFVDAGWEVITIDIEPKLHPTICADITKIDWTRFGAELKKKVNVLVASPPCQAFSFARNRYGVLSRDGTGEMLRIVAACFDAKETLKPDFWAIENPKGYLRWFLGKPGITVRQSDFGRLVPKPTDLWGNIPLRWLDKQRHITKKGSKWESFRNWRDSDTEHTAQGRAKIPIDLSNAILEAVESQP